MKPIPTDRHITYQSQFRTCGKSSCNCKQGGKKHGPYIFAFWRDENGKVHSGYVGKTMPQEQGRK